MQHNTWRHSLTTTRRRCSDLNNTEDGWWMARKTLTIYSRLVTICTTTFKFQKCYILPTESTYLFCTSIFPCQCSLHHCTIFMFILPPPFNRTFSGRQPRLFRDWLCPSPWKFGTFYTLTRLSTREDFIEFCGRESLKKYIILLLSKGQAGEDLEPSKKAMLFRISGSSGQNVLPHCQYTKG